MSRRLGDVDPSLIRPALAGLVPYEPGKPVEEVLQNLSKLGDKETPVRKLPVTALPGASYAASSESFALIRGGRLDVAVLGALQVDERGRVANWAVPGRPILGVGGAMDLLAGARRVIVATTHLTRGGEPKLVKACTYPLTGQQSVDLVVTERATFNVDGHGLTLVELADGVSAAWVAAHTEAAFRTAVDPTPDRHRP